MSGCKNHKKIPASLGKIDWNINGKKSSYLDKPCQEKNESYKVEVGAPARETVNCSVHKEHPPLLRRSLIHSKDAGTYNNNNYKNPVLILKTLLHE